MFEYIIIGAIIGGIAYYLFRGNIRTNKQIPVNDVKNKIEYFKTDISDKFKKFISKLTLPTAIGIAFVLFIFSPNKLYYIVFTGIFGYTLFRAFEKIASIKNILIIDFKTNKLGLFQLSGKRFNDYSILDESGKPTAINYMLHAKNNDVIIGDGINTNKQYLIINPVCSNIEFLKNFKDVDAELKQKLNEVINENNKLKSEMEYKTLLDANKIYTEHPILTLFENSENNAKNNGGGK